MVAHLFQTTTPFPEKLSDGPHMFVGYVNSHAFGRLVGYPIDDFGEHLRLAYREFEAFAAHNFNEDGELKFASALNLPRIGPFGWEKAQ